MDLSQRQSRQRVLPLESVPSVVGNGVVVVIVLVSHRCHMGHWLVEPTTATTLKDDDWIGESMPQSYLKWIMTVM